jgi:acetyltransferase-like isoleucine patch superfamily enzyme
VNVGGGCITAELPESVQLPADYFLIRGIFLDCRGHLEIAESSIWGCRVMVLTQSHDITSGKPEAVVNKSVVVERGAWIGSGALLYNCRIRHGAIVAAGAVVRNQTVEPHTMVEGNPARVIKRWDKGEGKWIAV